MPQPTPPNPPPPHQLPAPKVHGPIETCMRSITVSGLIPNAILNVFVNGAPYISTPASSTIEVALGPLSEGDRVTASQLHANFSKLKSPPSAPVTVTGSAGFYYTTQHFDVARTGWNPHETALTVANVPKLQRKFSYYPGNGPDQVYGTIYAQPLYAHHVNIEGKGAHNVVFVATENDIVYAFDADTKQPALWTAALISPSEMAVPAADVQPTDCENIKPSVGITSTPVIDCASHTLWVVAKTESTGGGFFYRLHALDISTGKDRIQPVVIAGSVTVGSQPVEFDPQYQLNRPALLLANGIVYVAFGSHCDFHSDQYHGWVFAYDASLQTSPPKLLGLFCTTADDGGSAGGIWQSGIGLAADPQGFIYFATGNGAFTANQAQHAQNYGDAVLKMTGALSVADYYATKDLLTAQIPPGDQCAGQNDTCWRLDHDLDLGSGGVLVLPDPPPKSKITPTLVIAGKDGNVLLIDRSNMGKYGGPLVQNPPATVNAVYGGPAYYRNSHHQFVYYCGDSDPIKAYFFDGKSLTLQTTSPQPFRHNGTPVDPQDPNIYSKAGTTPNVSSNQDKSGTAVVWAIERTNPLRLHAFDAANVANELLFEAGEAGIECGPWSNPDGAAFIEPTVVQGKVFVASDSQLTIFGL